MKLANCPLCGSDNITTLSMQSFTTGCRDCFQVKVQCFPTSEEAEAAWNKLFDHFADIGKMVNVLPASGKCSNLLPQDS